MAPDPPLAQVVDPDLGQTVVLDPGRDARIERALEHAGKSVTMSIRRVMGGPDRLASGSSDRPRSGLPGAGRERQSGGSAGA